MKIGLISDTHSYLDEKVFDYFEHVDEIWHAGDIGDTRLVDVLERFKPLRAVFGNIDDMEIRLRFPEHLKFKIEGLDIWMTHIGGRPPNYASGLKLELKKHCPDIFICGHSHMAKVTRDHVLDGMLYINPGAAGRQGFHHMKTIVRMELLKGKIDSLELIELGKRGAID